MPRWPLVTHHNHISAAAYRSLVKMASRDITAKYLYIRLDAGTHHIATAPPRSSGGSKIRKCAINRRPPPILSLRTANEAVGIHLKSLCLHLSVPEAPCIPAAIPPSCIQPTTPDEPSLNLGPSRQHKHEKVCLRRWKEGNERVCNFMPLHGKLVKLIYLPEL